MCYNNLCGYRCSAQCAFIVPYVYGTNTYPVCVWASHMYMRNSLLYRVGITLRGSISIPLICTIVQLANYHIYLLEDNLILIKFDFSAVISLFDALDACSFKNLSNFSLISIEKPSSKQDICSDYSMCTLQSSLSWAAIWQILSFEYLRFLFMYTLTITPSREWLCLIQLSTFILVC